LKGRSTRPAGYPKEDAEWLSFTDNAHDVTVIIDQRDRTDFMVE
jgi:hypothetical protein